MQLLETTLGRGRVIFSLFLVFILPIKWGGLFGVGLDVFLSLFRSIQNRFYPPSQLLKLIYFFIFLKKQKLRRFRFKNRQWKLRRGRFRNRQRWWSHQFYIYIYIYSFGCLHCRLNTSTISHYSLTINRSIVTLFSLMIYRSAVT
jgi:hypothetical protein